MSLSKDNSSRKVVLVLLTSYFFILFLLGFFKWKGENTSLNFSRMAHSFSFQSLNFCIAIIFVTVKQTRKQKQREQLIETA